MTSESSDSGSDLSSESNYDYRFDWNGEGLSGLSDNGSSYSLRYRYIMDYSDDEDEEYEEDRNNPNRCCDITAINDRRNGVKQKKGDPFRSFKTTPLVRQVARVILRPHFMFNTGAKIESVYYNKGEVPSPGNDFHVCFAPRREVQEKSSVVEIMDVLKLRKGQSFLHLGSGTGYINTLAGALIGGSGVNHGVEVNPEMLAYAEERQKALRDHCQGLENFEYCEPTFVLGDCLKLDSTPRYYDRILCSGILPEGYDTFLCGFLKHHGLLFTFPNSRKQAVMRRKGNGRIVKKTTGHFPNQFSYYPFVTDDSDTITELPENFPSLQELSRAAIRVHLRSVIKQAHVTNIRKRRAERESEKSRLQASKRLKMSDPISSPETDVVVNREMCLESLGDKLQNLTPSFNDLTENKEIESDEDISSASVENMSTASEENISTASNNSGDKDLCEDTIESEQESIDEEQSEHESSDDDTEDSSDAFSELSDPYGERECSHCVMRKDQSHPKPVCPYTPNLPYPCDTFYGKINTLPLPNDIIMYLKYKNNLIN